MLATKLDFVHKATDDDVLQGDCGPTRWEVSREQTARCRTRFGKWGVVAESQETQNGSRSARARGEASAGEKNVDVPHQRP